MTDRGQASFDDRRFTVSVQDTHGGKLTAAGTIGGSSSTDTAVTLGFDTKTYQSVGPCTVSFTKNRGGTLLGRFACPEVDLVGSPGATCSVTSLSTDGFTPESYFQFANCGAP